MAWMRKRVMIQGLRERSQSMRWSRTIEFTQLKILFVRIPFHDFYSSVTVWEVHTYKVIPYNRHYDLATSSQFPSRGDSTKVLNNWTEVSVFWLQHTSLSAKPSVRCTPQNTIDTMTFQNGYTRRRYYDAMFTTQCLRFPAYDGHNSCQEHNFGRDLTDMRLDAHACRQCRRPRWRSIMSMPCCHNRIETNMILTMRSKVR